MALTENGALSAADVAAVTRGGNEQVKLMERESA